MAAITHSIPKHIAIIMDGNGRWAQQRGRPRLAGHEAGAETVRCVLKYCREAGVRFLTLYAFSTENWSRPKSEINGLMTLLGRFLQQHGNELVQQEIRLRVMGQISDLAPRLRRALEEYEHQTVAFERQLILALSYSGRREIVHATQCLLAQALANGIRPEELTESMLAKYLYLPDVPDPDLIIRTSGELRLSNFMLWQAAYSEFYATPVMWPDFREADFQAALVAYAHRQRRFGGVPLTEPPKPQHLDEERV